jgi:tetratricopeptide (TPR) repeat protein
MTRWMISFVLVLAFAHRASADPAVIVLGPAAEKLPAPRAKLVQAAISKAAVGKPGERAVDSMCVADTLCLQGHGTALGAVRVLAIAAEPSRTAATIDLTLVLVDIEGKELIAKRAVSIADNRIARELGKAVVKFLDEGPVERAKALFDKGNQHYNLGEFAVALDLYKRAYRVKALPAFLFNIAQCHRKLEQHKEAVAMYQSYLVGVPDAPNKALVESLITESKGKLTESARLSEQADIAKRDAEKADIERKRAEADRKAKEAAAVAERAKIERAKIGVQRDRELDKTYNRHPARKVTMVTTSLGIATAVVGGVFAFQARRAQSAFDDAGCSTDTFLGEAALVKCNSDRERGDRDARLANILFASAGAAVLGSIVVFAIDPGNIERPDRARAQVGVSPGGVKVVIRW